MGYIHCCSGLHKTRSFVLSPVEGFVLCEMDYLLKCPVCGHTVLQITRVNNNNDVSSIRYINRKAKEMFEKLKLKVLYESKLIDYSKIPKGTFYLNYNEFGVKKRCYSNISNMKIGLVNYI